MQTCATRIDKDNFRSHNYTIYVHIIRSKKHTYTHTCTHYIKSTYQMLLTHVIQAYIHTHTSDILVPNHIYALTYSHTRLSTLSCWDHHYFVNISFLSFYLFFQATRHFEHSVSSFHSLSTSLSSSLSICLSVSVSLYI